MRSELWDLSLKFVVVRKMMHSTVGLHRVKFLFSLNFISVFIGVYSLGTSIPKNPKGCTTALVGGTRSPCFFHLLVFLGVFVSGFGASVLSFLDNT